MSAPVGRRLVIDADVLHGEGRPGTPNESGAARLAFLNAVLSICHHAAVSAELSAEWRSHASPEAWKWHAAMSGRGKAEPVALLDDAALRERVLATAPTYNERAIMAKDWHLIVAALQSDGLIVSCDRKARLHFGRAASRVEELRPLVWVDPHDAGVHSWLLEGAPPTPERCLGHRP